MTWIEFHPGKIKKLQKFSDLRRMLQWNVNETLGFLGSFWGEVIDLREDGNISGWNPAYICDLTGIGIDPERVWDALVACRWIDAVPERVLVHDWLETAGKFLAKKYSSSNKEKLVEIWTLHGKRYGSDPQADEKRTERVPTLPFPSPPNQPKKKTTTKTVRFEKPTAAQITAYAAEIGFFLDGRKFFDYYESKGWLVGKAPMKSWQACIRTWKSNGYESGGSNVNGNTRPTLHDRLFERERKVTTNRPLESVPIVHGGVEFPPGMPILK